MKEREIERIERASAEKEKRKREFIGSKTKRE